MRLQTLVAFTDFSPSAEQAVARAALLAAEHKAELHLLHGSAGPDAKHVDPQARLGQLARQLARRHGIVVKALAHGGAGLVQRILHAAAGADLLVLGHSLAAGVAAMWRGDMLSQILRASPCPVLVVQRATRGAYRHVLVKMDAWPQSQALVHFAGALDEAAAVELFHRARLGDRIGPCVAELAHGLRDELRRRMHGRRVRLSDVFDARRNRVGLKLGQGVDDKARQLAVQQHRSGADLVALTQQRRRWLGDWLQGGMLRHLLGHADCDLLVYPHDRPQATPGGRALQSRVARRWTQAI